MLKNKKRMRYWKKKKKLNKKKVMRYKFQSDYVDIHSQTEVLNNEKVHIRR